MAGRDRKRDQLRAELQTARCRVVEIEKALLDLDADEVSHPSSMVVAPQEMREAFRKAQQYVADYFQARWEDPRSAQIVFSGERYILIRAASMSTEFFQLVTSLYRDRGPQEARAVASGFLFDVAHALGKADAAIFHTRMGVTDPVERLSAGPVHFAYTGWALVDIYPDSTPSPDEHFFLHYDHPNSFEAEAWLKRDPPPDFPVCAMNAGYSSGWCEQSFGIPLVACEVSCRAMGDAACQFIMAPPSRIQEHLARLKETASFSSLSNSDVLEVPEFFRRKRLEDDLRLARNNLEVRVAERTAELEQRNEDLRNANKRLADLYQAQEEFVAMVSHELRTPLVTGLGYVDLLLRGKLGSLSEGIESGMQVAQRNLRQLASLVDDILRYHQLSQGDQTLAHPAPCDLGAMCMECVEDLLVRTGKQQQSVSCEAPKGLALALVDQDTIRQVISNLLNNAVQHAGEEARIRVSLDRLSNDRARVTVCDDGRGMTPEMLQHAYEPFVRSGTRQRGLGLGLSIVRRLLNAYDSELVIESVLGRGTTASFVLPLVKVLSSS